MITRQKHNPFARKTGVCRAVYRIQLIDKKEGATALLEIHSLSANRVAVEVDK